MISVNSAQEMFPVQPKLAIKQKLSCATYYSRRLQFDREHFACEAGPTALAKAYACACGARLPDHRVVDQVGLTVPYAGWNDSRTATFRWVDGTSYCYVLTVL